MNNVNIIGRCASSPEKHFIEQFNKFVVKFALAFDNRTRKTDGEKLTFFIDCEAWAEVAERIYDNIDKGDKMGISGHLEQKKFKRQDGSTGSKIFIVVSTIEFLSPPKNKTPIDKVDTDDNGVVSEEIPEDDELPF